MTRALVALLLVVAPTAPALAQPMVRVRAEARLELRVARIPDRVAIRGMLRDDLGQALADRRVRLRVLDARGSQLHETTAPTDSLGAFTVSFPLEPSTYHFVAAWDGDDGHRRVEAHHDLDLTRAHVRLEVRLRGGRLDLDSDTHTIDVRATSEAGGAELEIEVRDELERLLARGRTDASGRVSLTLRSTDLGEPAAGRLIVRTPGDVRRAEAQTEVPIVRFRPLELVLHASSTHIREGEIVVLSGELRDRRGPHARRAVGLFANETHLDTVLTDDAGRFSRPIELASDDGRPVMVTARFTSDAPWRPDARSAPIAITIDRTGTTPWTWLLAPMIACAIAVGLLSRRRGSTRTRHDPEERVSATPGIVPARPSGVLSTPMRNVAGIVLDAAEGTPIAGARILLEREGARIQTTTDAEGRFSVAELDGGIWTLEIVALGYERSTTSIRLPHRGQWSAATVRLRNLREVALERYRPVAHALAPSRRGWALWTPRELLERASRRTNDLEELTAAVEQAVYAKPPPDEAHVAAIAERSNRIASELHADVPNEHGRR